MTLNTIYRRGVLGVADASPVSSFVKRQGWKLGVGRFVAGETLEQAITVLHELENEGMHGILDLLGEFVGSAEGANAITGEILATIDRLSREPVTRHMSVKPTQLGLAVGRELGLENARKVATRAKEADTLVCLDMENYPYVEDTVWLLEQLYNEGHHHVSTVLQSYLKRSLDDLDRVLALSPAPRLRIVKGAYLEGPDVAFQDKAEVDAKYREMVYRALEAGATVGVATHDEAIIAETKAYLRGADIGAEQCEFQFLYGVKPALQKSLVDEGYRLNIYLPYGEDWYGYFSRRLAERPANALFVLRGLFG